MLFANEGFTAPLVPYSFHPIRTAQAQPRAGWLVQYQGTTQASSRLTYCRRKVVLTLGSILVFAESACREEKMLYRMPSIRAASTVLVLAQVLALGIPRFVLGQGCSAYAGETFEQLQAQSASLSRALDLELARNEAAYRRIWSNANIAATDAYNFNLGLFLGRAVDYEKLTQTLQAADNAFSSGNNRVGFSEVMTAFKQAKGLALGMTGAFAPPPFTDIPTTPKAAWDFSKNALAVLHNYAVDAKGTVISLSGMGNAMKSSENSLKAVASLRQQISVLQQCMNYAPHVAATPPKKGANQGGPSRQDYVDANNRTFAALQRCSNALVACQMKCALSLPTNAALACQRACASCDAEQAEWNKTMKQLQDFDLKQAQSWSQPAH